MKMSVRNVLLIDDDELSFEFVAKYLETENVRVTWAENGPQGLLQARTERPDVILLDVHMVGIDGWNVCEQLKADPTLMNVPVLFLTANDNVTDKLRGLNLGALDYIIKPFDPPELLARVRTSLRISELFDLLERSAKIDALSAVWNRAYFNERLTCECNLTERMGTELSLVMADIDHFKSINDTHGHLSGDRVIQRFAAILKESARRQDIVCRYGGEEFAILLPATSPTNAIIYAERARQRIAAEMFAIPDRSIRVTASFGISGFTGNATKMISDSDAALYNAKRSGRNCIGNPQQEVKVA